MAAAGRMKGILEAERNQQQSLKSQLLNICYVTSYIVFKIIHPTPFHDLVLDFILSILRDKCTTKG